MIVLRSAIVGTLAMLLTASLTSPALAEPTRVVVRVLSKGAKFIGTSMGGVRIVIRDAATKEVLAQGVTEGTTGDTARIMGAARGAVMSDEVSAAFRATLDLVEPRFVEIEASGPLAQRQSIVRATTQLWLLPGRHLTSGDGVTFEVPGYAVDIVAPTVHRRFGAGTRSIELRANAVLMCGCPLEPGGTWDANRAIVEAFVKREGKLIARVPLRYANEASQFETRVNISEPGTYEAVVTVFDPATGNSGVDHTTFIIAP